LDVGQFGETEFPLLSTKKLCAMILKNKFNSPQRVQGRGDELKIKKQIPPWRDKMTMKNSAFSFWTLVCHFDF